MDSIALFALVIFFLTFPLYSGWTNEKWHGACLSVLVLELANKSLSFARFARTKRFISFVLSVFVNGICFSLVLDFFFFPFYSCRLPFIFIQMNGKNATHKCDFFFFLFSFPWYVAFSTCNWISFDFNVLQQKQ